MIGKFNNIIVVIFVLVISACAAIIPTEHLITKDQLTSTMQKHFPLHRERGMFSITLDVPQLNLDTSLNRIGMAGHFSAHAAILKFEGDFTFSSQLKYDPETRAVFLNGVNLDSLNLNHGNAIPAIVRTEINRMLNEYAANNPAYRFKPDELVVLGVKVAVEDIGVVPGGVLLKLRTVH
jgi:hypothetical protein